MSLTIVVIGLGVFAVVNLLKYLLPVVLLPAAKLLLAFTGSLIGAAVFASSVREAALVTLGAWGASVFAHTLHKAISASGDRYRQEVVNGARRR